MQSHVAVLGELLGGFYEFLGRASKPSDEEVRTEFMNRERKWKQYCANKQLGNKATSLFNSEVAQLWQKKLNKNSGANEK